MSNGSHDMNEALESHPKLSTSTELISKNCDQNMNQIEQVYVICCQSEVDNDFIFSRNVDY